jgi:hypothetical protein
MVENGAILEQWSLVFQWSQRVSGMSGPRSVSSSAETNMFTKKRAKVNNLLT